jgi:hypothetical protein
VSGDQSGVGSWIPAVPPVSGRLNAASWKMKKIAMVTTTNVWRRVRSATIPIGIAASPATRPPTGSSAKTSHPPLKCQSRAASATA